MRRPDNDDLAYGLGLALGLLGLIGFGFAALREARYVDANDFAGIWAGARALALGSDPYDAETWRATALALQSQIPETAVYGYPAWVAAALAPLALLPLRAASLVWTIGGMVLAAAALRALLRDRVPGLPAVHTLTGLALLLSQPAVISFYDGQWSYLLIALVSLALVLERRRPAIAGSIGALAILAKPHLFLLALPGLAREAGPRAALAAVTTAAVAIAISLAAAPGWVAPYLQHVAASRVPATPRGTALPTALFDLVGPAGLWLSAGVLLAVALLAATAAPGDRRLAASLAVSIAFAPYVWSYDHHLLLVPLVLACGALRRVALRLALALAVAGSLLLLIGGTVLHGVFADARGSESFNGVVSGGFAVLVTALLRLAPRPRH